ncbi:hypothetical protein ACQ9BO_10135 [Flavobacterium sp. P21]|uniref:hypothetical protein n=1 Tax=Flavobacterium sp. P21 TaxID=3423948 RepID=UPI003D670384
MLTIGLSRLIRPYNNILDYYSSFKNGIVENYPIEILVNDSYVFRFKQKLSDCNLDLTIQLRRELENYGRAFIFVNCRIINSLEQQDSLVFKIEPEKFNKTLILNFLNNNKIFKEFHLFNSHIENWNLITDELHTYSESKNSNHLIMCPKNPIIDYQKININPAIIKFNNRWHEKHLKRYSFCLIIIFKDSQLSKIFNLKEYYSHYFHLEKINFEFGNKEIGFKINSNLVSTEFDEDSDPELDFYIRTLSINLDAISNEVFNQKNDNKINKIVLEFKHVREIVKYNLELTDIKNIENLYSQCKNYIDI